jgi:hypothetical protein
MDERQRSRHGTQERHQRDDLRLDLEDASPHISDRAELERLARALADLLARWWRDSGTSEAR